MPVPPAVPAFSNYVPNFTMGGGNLPVPYRAPGLPATIPGQAPYTPNFAMDPLEGSYPPPAVMGGAGEQLGVGGADAASALAADPALASTPGLLSRLIGPIKTALGVGGLPLLAAGSALAADPGQLSPTNSDGSPDPLASLLNPNPDETGLTSTLKGMGRGVAKAGSMVNSGIGSAYDYLTQPKAERDLQNELAQEKAQGPGDTSEAPQDYTIDQALGLNSAASALSGAPTRIADSHKSNPVLDSLMALIGKTAPSGKAATAEPGKRLDYQMLAASQALLGNPGLSPDARAMLELGTGIKGGGMQYDASIVNQNKSAKKEQTDWGLKAAEAGTKIAEEQGKEDKESGIKVHATRNGIMVEGDEVGEDGKSYKVIQPISNAIFQAQTAGALDPKMKVELMGKKFGNLDKDPYGKEKMLLGELESSGDLGTIMAQPEMAKAMQEADKQAMKIAGGATSTAGGLDKLKWDARRAVMLKNMTTNPKFRQALINKVIELRKKTHTAPGVASALEGNYSSPYEAPYGTMEGDGTDFLNEVTR